MEYRNCHKPGRVSPRPLGRWRHSLDSAHREAAVSKLGGRDAVRGGGEGEGRLGSIPEPSECRRLPLAVGSENVARRAEGSYPPVQGKKSLGR